MNKIWTWSEPALSRTFYREDGHSLSGTSSTGCRPMCHFCPLNGKLAVLLYRFNEAVLTESVLLFFMY